MSIYISTVVVTTVSAAACGNESAVLTGAGGEVVSIYHGNDYYECSPRVWHNGTAVLNETRGYFLVISYALIGMNVSAGACGNVTAVLSEARGEFGSNYGKDESCQWRIQVDEDQVNIAGFCLLF